MIIVDDASPDGTLEVAKELQRIYGEDKLVCLLTPFFVVPSVADVPHLFIAID